MTSPPLSTVDRAPLAACVLEEPASITALAARYRDAAPFPHLVLDGLFDDAVLERLDAAYDAVDPRSWHTQDGLLQLKRRTREDCPLPADAQAYFDHVNSGPFIRLLSAITGIRDLLPDPALYGGGMHEVGAGGYFEVHVDFAEHPRTRLENRLTVITYLNRGWTEQDGGALELWQKAPLRCARSILPSFGRTVIFEQSPDALHGHTVPVGRSPGRRAVIAYYYTNARTPALPADTLPTRYYRRKGQSLVQKAEILARDWMPPILLSVVKSLRQASRHRPRRRAPGRSAGP